MDTRGLLTLLFLMGVGAGIFAGAEDAALTRAAYSGSTDQAAGAQVEYVREFGWTYDRVLWQGQGVHLQEGGHIAVDVGPSWRLEYLEVSLDVKNGSLDLITVLAEDYQDYVNGSTFRYLADRTYEGTNHLRVTMGAAPNQALTLVLDNREWPFSSGDRLLNVTGTIVGHYRFSTTLSIPADAYEEARGNPRPTLDELATPGDPVVGALARTISRFSAREGLNEWEEVENILAFVQALPYAHDDRTTGQPDYWRYPVQTLVDGSGDCEDFAALFASLSSALGYPSALAVTPRHMGALVHVTEGRAEPWIVLNGTNYYYAEATTSSRPDIHQIRPSPVIALGDSAASDEDMLDLALTRMPSHRTGG